MIKQQGDDKAEGGDGAQAVTPPQHAAFIHTVHENTRGRSKKYSRQAEGDNGNAYQRRGTGDFLDQDEQSIIRGIQDGHGEQLCQPQEQKIPVFEQGAKASLWTGYVHRNSVRGPPPSKRGRKHAPPFSPATAGQQSSFSKGEPAAAVCAELLPECLCLSPQLS